MSASTMPRWRASSRPWASSPPLARGRPPLPAWDCLPYDRVSPHRDIVARRIDAIVKAGTEGGRGAARW